MNETDKIPGRSELYPEPLPQRGLESGKISGDDDRPGFGLLLLAPLQQNPHVPQKEATVFRHTPPHPYLESDHFFLLMEQKHSRQ